VSWSIDIAGRWRFRPALVPGAVAAGLIVLTVALGNWQTRRAEEKAELSRRLDQAARSPALAVPAAPVAAEVVEHRHVVARGRYVASATLFLDNKVHAGAAGYHVITPLRLEGAEIHVLVDRGWIAAGDRRSLPGVATPEGAQTVEGIAAVPPRRIFELAPESESGSLRQNLVLDREQQRLRVPLQPFVILQTSPGNDGLVREWERPDTNVARHRGYALQWYSFAALAVIFYVIVCTRRIRP
jgi:surfeit locus 1 family protein